MSVAIGIDFGTTFSCIACYRNDKVEIISDKHGQHLIPSLVHIDPTNQKVSVGNTAYDLSTQHPENLLRDAKRILGRKFNDVAIAKIIQKNYLARDHNDMVVFEVTVAGQKVLIKPEEVSAEVLKYLKTMAEDYLGEEVNDAVISIPAYFSNGQRKATKTAAALAGINVLKFTTDPVATALHYIKDRNASSKFMVFDWGGGTLDISFMNVSDGTGEVKGVFGDTLLGGRNIDDNLFKHFYAPVDKHPTKFVRRLLHNCVLLKEKLSSMDEVNSIIECCGGPNDSSISLNRDLFNEINKDIFEHAMDIVTYGMNDLGYTNKDVDYVILVGGSTRIPKIQEMLADIFGPEKIKTDLNPDESVAAGACLQAAILKEQLVDLETYKIIEVTPLSLGIEVYGGLMYVYIPRNSKLPVSKSFLQKTALNDQESLSIAIYEGERKNVNYNNLLAVLFLTGLPKKRAGEVECLITFDLDENGILTVFAYEESTGRRNHLMVTLSDFRLDEQKIKFNIEEAREVKLEDDAFEEFVVSRYHLFKKCNDLLYEADKIESENDREFIKEQCNKFLKFTEVFTDAVDKHQLESRYNFFRNLVFPTLKKYPVLNISF